MLPATHAHLIDAALAAVDHGGLRARVALVQAGSIAEDRLRIPIVGWTVQSPGLSHTYRPGHARGELGAPSALTRIERLIGQAMAWWPRTPDRAAHHLGRALHLLGDVAVPARARGVWHPLGDPYEQWVDDHLGSLAALPVPVVTAPTITAIVDGMARRAAAEVADTTRSPWGALAHRLGRTRIVVDDALAEQQARTLFPAAVGHHVALVGVVAARLGAERDQNWK